MAPQTWARCSRSVPGADVHVQARDGQAAMIGPPQAVVQLLVPDAVLRLLAAGVGLLAVAVAEAGIDPQRDLAPWSGVAQLVDHVGRAAVDGDAVLDAPEPSASRSKMSAV